MPGQGLQTLARLAGHMLALVPASADMLGGLELGGVPLATMLSQLTGLPALFIRKQAKTYGTLKLAEAGLTMRSVLTKDLLDAAAT